MAKKAKKPVLEKETVSKILRTVPRHEAFHFYKTVGESTGKFATSLADFCEKIQRIDIRSVNFHFKRREFERWIRETLGDIDLARRIGKIKKSAHGEKLRTEINQIVKKRLDELKET